MNDIQWLFWDNDGVLVDTEPMYFRASAEILAEADVHLTRERFVDLSLRQGRSVFDLLPDRSDRHRLRARRDRRYAELLEQGVAPMAGARETLRNLHGRVKMAIVTSSHREHFEIIHRHTELLGFFDFVLTREDYPRTKPHPDPYQMALTRSAGAARHCLVVEDSQRGLDAAVAAGLSCLVIPGTLNADSDFASAHAILKDLSQVVAFLGPADRHPLADASDQSR